jgi:hypothetical protein
MVAFMVPDTPAKDGNGEAAAAPVPAQALEESKEGKKTKLHGLFKWINRAPTWLGSVSALLGILNIVGTFVVGVMVWAVRDVLNPGPAISMACPRKIRSHLQDLDGTIRRPHGANRDLRIIVHPHDPGDEYWVQDGRIEMSKSGEWTREVRFGNEFGRGHRKPLPTDYDVYAFLIDPKQSLGDSRAFPLIFPSEAAFIDRLRKCGVDKSEMAECRLTREPEPVACTTGISIQSPMRINDHNTQVEVDSPVRLAWKPNIPLYVALLTSESRPVKVQAEGHTGPWVWGERMKNDQTIYLEPGEYELRVSKDKSSCYENVWFTVRQR